MESIMQTHRTIPNNEPDIIIRDNKNGTYALIEVAISGDRNVTDIIKMYCTERVMRVCDELNWPLIRFRDGFV
jgi:hypothetical protein